MSVPVLYPLVTEFLNESGAYKEWESAFRSHGLILTIAGVEKVMMEPFSKSGVKCPSRMKCENLRVPCDAMVQMNIEPGNATAVK
jgi:hypothetical protein